MNRTLTIPSNLIQPLIMIVALIVIMGVAGAITPGFLTLKHLSNVMYCNTMLGILALSQTLVILSGGIDMSVGSIYWITIMTGAMLMADGSFVLPALLCIVLGCVIGLVNGIGISFFRIPHVVMTLAMMIILTGVLYVTTGGGGRGRAAESLIALSTGRVAGIPIITIVWIVLTVLLFLVLRFTSFGWKIRALGCSIVTCHLSGIRYRRVQILVYVLSGLLAAIAGLFYLGWARTPYPTFQSGAGVGAALSLDSIAAVIIGGTLFTGGRGGVERTFLGVLVVAVLFSILSMLGLGMEWQIMLNGFIILVIVGVYSRLQTQQ